MAVLDGRGGMRVVITDGDPYAHLTAPGERLIIVPGYTIEEPVPLEDIPGIVAKVEEFIRAKT